ncbi:MAG: LysR family transcriptional regulator [Peptococcaceae bacterium]|nr:LysR family transcriptional regulator [Peptococcaceae bacterium]
MNLEQFYYLQEVGKEKSIHKASKIIHISPQALSRSLIKLEKDLQVQLFERSRHGITLTEQGEQILIASQKFLQELAAICHASEEPQENILSGEYTLLTTYGFGNFSPGVLSEIYRKAPELQLTLQYEVFDDIIASITQEDFEIALINITSIDNRNIHDFVDDNFIFYHLESFRYFCMINRHLPPSQYKKVSLQTLAQYPFVIQCDEMGQSYGTFLDITEKICTPVQVILEKKPDFILELVKANLGVAFAAVSEKMPLPEASSMEIAHVELSNNICTEFGFIVKKGKKLSAKTIALMNILKSAMR